MRFQQTAVATRRRLEFEPCVASTAWWCSMGDADDTGTDVRAAALQQPWEQVRNNFPNSKPDDS